jgi:hypothetical protein
LGNLPKERGECGDLTDELCCNFAMKIWKLMIMGVFELGYFPQMQ